MLLCGEPSIRDVIAFPKTQRAACLLTNAPSEAARAQLDELSLRVETDRDGRPGEKRTVEMTVRLSSARMSKPKGVLYCTPASPKR
jgi:hypothetical protein